MKQFLTMQKIALFSKASFLILRKTWFLNYLLHQMFLLNLKSHATMLILSLRTYVLKNFLKHFLKKILNTLKSLDTSKGAGIDNLSRKFPKDGSDILARPISQLCDLSIELNSFPRSCKIELKQALKLTLEITAQFHYSPPYQKIFHGQTKEFLSKNNIFYRIQSDF